MTTLGQREKCLRKHPKRVFFPGVAWAPDANPASPGAAEGAWPNTGLNLAGKGLSGYTTSWNRRLETEIPVQNGNSSEMKWTGGFGK